MIMMQSQVMYIMEGVQLQISQPWASEMPDQHRQDMFFSSLGIYSFAWMGFIRSSLVVSMNFTMTCQLFLNQAFSSTALSSYIFSGLRSKTLKYLSLSSSILSSAIARKPQVYSYNLLSFPAFSLRQVKKIVSCSLTFFATLFQFLMIVCINLTMILFLSMKQSNSPFMFFSMLLIYPMKKELSLRLSPLPSFMIFARFLLDYFQQSSKRSNNFSSYFQLDFNQARYLCSSLVSQPWIESRVLYICLILLFLSFRLRDIDNRTLSMLLLQVGNYCCILVIPLGSFGSTFSTTFGINLASSFKVVFSVFSQTKACISFSSATICTTSLILLRVISEALRIFLMRACWMGTQVLKNSYFLEYHSTNCCMVCLVFSICALFMREEEVLADIVSIVIVIQQFKMFSFGTYYSQGQKVLDREGQLGEIWISGYDFAHNLSELKKNNITAVCSGVDLHFTYPEEIIHLKFNLNDCQSQDATHTFRPAYEWIESARKGGKNVLVHCAAGISRCSTILIAYMLQKYGWTFDYSLKLIQERRPCCQPNTGFCKQLREFQQKLKNK